MNFSKKSRYGLRALIDLSVYSKESHVALAAIAERNSISPQYLEQVFAALRKAGIRFRLRKYYVRWKVIISSKKRM